MNDIAWCNWTFWEVIQPYTKWVVGRDCQGGRESDTTITLSREGGKNWKAYKNSLAGHPQGTVARNAKCPNCGRQINGVNPYDDGETWRM